MKKTIVMLLCAALVFACGTGASAYNGEYTEMRLGLFYGSTAQDTVTLHSSGGFNICLGEDGNYAYLFSMLEDDIVITKSGEKDFMINGNPFWTTGQFAIKPAYGKITVNGTEYRGFVSLKRLSSGDITVINVIGLEEYLWGVVGKEMSPSWNNEALKAQALCARSYALTHRNDFASYGFDLTITQRSQVYGGTAAETESTRRAVSETAGKAIRYNGNVVEAFFFASDGGSTEDVKNVWGSSLPYLKAVLDPYEKPEEASRYFWNVTLSRDEVIKKLVSKSILIGDVQNIEITETAPTGRVTGLRVTGSRGEYNAKREGARTLFSLYSQFFAVTRSEDGETYTFSGKGYGHAVGMSQWGAKAMADRGFSCDDIIKFYFTGVEVY